jgi:hypothetical protein
MKSLFLKLLPVLAVSMLGATHTLYSDETSVKQRISRSQPVYIVLIDPWQEESLKLERLARQAKINKNILWVNSRQPWIKDIWHNTLELPIAFEMQKNKITKERVGINTILVFLLANVDLN